MAALEVAEAEPEVPVAQAVNLIQALLVFPAERASVLLIQVPVVVVAVVYVLYAKKL
jgi:hypothetical protein